MTSARLFSGPLVLLSFFFVFTDVSSAQQSIQIRFRAIEKSMMVVPVMINGAGPFDFQFDTGASSSIIEGKLAEELHLRVAGRATLQTAQSEAATTWVHVGSVGMADATVTDLDVLVVERWGDSRIKVRGVLGEDFLQHFDVLIDNRHHVIQLETGPGRLGNMLAGEHLPLTAYGSGGERLDPNRLVIVGEFDEARNEDAKLQLDSGAPCVLLFSQVGRPDSWNQPETFPVTGVLKGSFAAYARTLRLHLGKGFFSDVTAIVPTETVAQLNVAGLLPTSVFRSIFISHSERFVILNPSVRKSPAKEVLATLKSPGGKPDDSDAGDE